MAHTEELQERLYKEMRGRIQEADLSVPEKIDDYILLLPDKRGKTISR